MTLIEAKRELRAGLKLVLELLLPPAGKYWGLAHLAGVYFKLELKIYS